MKDIGFIAGSDGAVVKYDPKIHSVQPPRTPTGPLTKHQRATLYFKALRFLKSLLCQVGFRETVDFGHSGFTIEMDNFLLEMVVKEAPRVAHVTSYPGYSYDPDRIAAKVEMMTPGNGDYVIQASATHRNGRTEAPVFIVVRADSPNPLKEAFMTTLTTAHRLLAPDAHLMAKIRAALAKRNIDQEYERLEADDAVSESGAGSRPRITGSTENSGGGAGGGGYDQSIPI